MEETFKIWKNHRQNLLRFLDRYTNEQINLIPTGFNNNLIWNIGHVVVTQQRLVYGLSGLPMNISDELFLTYKSGSAPVGEVSPEQVNELRVFIDSLVSQTIFDYNAQKFGNYQEMTTSTGFHLQTTDNGIVFNNFHEGLHLGYMMSIRKFL